MALEAVVFQQDFFGYNSKDLHSLFGPNWSYDPSGMEKQEDKICSEHFPDNQTISSDTTNFVHGEYNWTTSISSPTSNFIPPHLSDPSSSSARPKRRRSKSRKNKEEIENQRMTHIAVERNRRKQMNEYLAVLRSLMPESYVQRGDQASIIGGAINFVKELEQRLQLLSAKKEVKEIRSDESAFAEFFTFPQYSTSSTQGSGSGSSSGLGCVTSINETLMVDQTRPSIADIEVTMVESHANLKIRSKRRPAQLLRLVSGLNSMRLSILHLNVATVDQTVLYSLSVKVEDDCKLTSVDDIATAVNELVGRIQEDDMLN